MDDPPHHEGAKQGLNLAISLCLTYTLCIVCVRLWIRKGVFGVDDLVVLIATIFTLGHTATDYVALAYGLGKPWGAINYTGAIPKIHGASIAGIVLFWIALYISKLAVLAFLARITKNKFQLHVYYLSSAATAALGLISVLVATVDCPSSGGFYWAFYNNHSSCPSQATRWHVLTAFDVVTETGLLLLPMQLVWSLQMPMKKKLMVLAAFYLRIPVIGLSLARTALIMNLDNRASEPSYDGAMVVILLEVELTYALAANTLSALKAFTESFNSGFGQGFTYGKGSQYDMSGLSKGSGQSSNGEKSKGGSEVKSTSSRMTGSAVRPEAANTTRDMHGVDRVQSPNSFMKKQLDRSRNPTSVMKLRPDREEGNYVTRVSVEPMRTWRTDHHPSSSETSADDMVIMRETELSIHHDKAPMLRTV